MTLVNQFARDPGRDLELRICERLADSRSWISRHVLTKQPPDSILLIDRWYPSDAAFRRAEHDACSRAFEQAIADHGWVLCRNEGAIEDATMQVVAEIYSAFQDTGWG